VSLVFGNKYHSNSSLLTSSVMSCSTGEVHTGVCCRNLREMDHIVDPGLDVKIVIRCIFS